VLRNTLAMLDRELGHADMGASLRTRRLDDIVLIQALRAYAAEHGASAGGWIRAALAK
jgi:plasmid stability protein